jgi:ribulose 1,5-bisphosphate synthetase/thiazole synthase
MSGDAEPEQVSVMLETLISSSSMESAMSSAAKFDILVVGGGLAGLVAASRAAELNATVLLMGKGSFLGDGNTQTTTGTYYTVRIRVTSDPDELYTRALRAGRLTPNWRGFGLTTVTGRLNG